MVYVALQSIAYIALVVCEAAGCANLSLYSTVKHIDKGYNGEGAAPTNFEKEILHRGIILLLGAAGFMALYILITLRKYGEI